MVSREEITFNLTKTRVSDYYDDRESMSMLKVLYADHLTPQILSKIAKTMDLLNALVDSGYLSSEDLTLLYDTIKITRCFSLNLKDTIESFPDVRKISISKFSDHRRKVMQFGMELTERDITRIDGFYNTVLKHYKDSWTMIFDLEQRIQVIKESDMTQFIEGLKQLTQMNKAVQKLENLTEDSFGHASSGALEAEYANIALKEPNEENFNQLLIVISDWWEENGNIDMLKVVISEFNDRHKTITLHAIEAATTPFELFSLLKGSGLIKPKKLNLLVEATVMCGLQGVEDKIKEHLELPDFSEVPFRVFSSHRRKILILGQVISQAHKVKLGQLNGIRVNKSTDPWIVIFKLELKDKFKEGEQMDKFIKKLRSNGMNREADAMEAVDNN